MTTKKELEDWAYSYLRKYHEWMVEYDMKFDKNTNRRK